MNNERATCETCGQEYDVVFSMMPGPYVSTEMIVLSPHTWTHLTHTISRILRKYLRRKAGDE